MSTAVRQTPLTAMLAPSLMSSRTRRHWMRMRWPAARTAPTSSTMPVNIYFSTLFRDVTFDGEFVGRDGMEPHAMQLNGVCATQPSGSTGHRKRLQAAQKFRGGKEEDLFDHAGLERRPIQLASRLDHQRPVLLPREAGRE